MKATIGFKASINGVNYELEKGEEFKGDARAQAILSERGFIAPTSSRKTAKKEETDER